MVSSKRIPPTFYIQLCLIDQKLADHIQIVSGTESSIVSQKHTGPPGKLYTVCRVDFLKRHLFSKERILQQLCTSILLHIMSRI
jgi:hypothetical protein